ncbi:MAG: hypothetical protein IT529_14270 [Burkholderiales bacterium]|nr:hypothetical protein [Burkholderiales bacterium]
MIAAQQAEPAPWRGSPWRIAWFVASLAWAVPVGNIAYERIVQVTYQARARLIVEYALWELHPEYHGSPQAWTRFASRLLTDNQLLRRVRLRHRDLANEIELDYRRDLTLAQGEVAATALAAWALPCAAVYGIGFLVARRRRRPATAAPAPAKPAYSEARYRP